MTRFKLITAAALTLMLTTPSFAVDIIRMHEQLTDQAVRYDIEQRAIAKSRSQHILKAREQRTDPSRHTATCQSADSHLQAIVASYTRTMLDRGGWFNAFAQTNGYAAGEPILAAEVGTGVTTPGADDLSKNPQISAR